MTTTLSTCLGALIKERREALHISQERLGYLIGRHRTYMGNLEKGSANPTLDTLERVARGLKTTVGELLVTAEERVAAAAARAPDHDRPRTLGRVAERRR